jgi:hypothetical protein
MAMSYQLVIDKEGQLVFLMYSIRDKNINMIVEGVKQQVQQLVFCGPAEAKDI